MGLTKLSNSPSSSHWGLPSYSKNGEVKLLTHTGSLVSPNGRSFIRPLGRCISRLWFAQRSVRSKGYVGGGDKPCKHTIGGYSAYNQSRILCMTLWADMIARLDSLPPFLTVEARTSLINYIVIFNKWLGTPIARFWQGTRGTSMAMHIPRHTDQTPDGNLGSDSGWFRAGV